jgi:hypothetical protein
MTTATTLTEWLRTSAQRDALLTAWAAGAVPCSSICETEALALVAQASKHERHIAIGHPGGRAKLPLLAAVHLAALQLDGYPSPFTPRRRGPVVFATRQFVRREELLSLDAAQAPISPALRAVRLRGDGAVVPISGGRPRPAAPENKLILINRIPELTIPSAAAVVVDGATEDTAFAEAAISWAAHAAVPVCVFEDSARRNWPRDVLTYSSGWAEIARHATPGSDSSLIAARRGHAAVLDAGPQSGLAKAAHLLADARRRQTALPPQLVEVSTIWRRLDELVTPLTAYDAACPRWRTRTLSERLDDMSQWRSSSFPDGWRTWAETCWAGVKEGIIDASESVSGLSSKAAILSELVDQRLSAGLSVDIALPSRTARDAVVRYLATAGILIPTDGSLNVRSLGDAQTCWPNMPTLLVSPPSFALRHRLTGGDIGAINVLCYEHEIHSLRTALSHNLDELLMPSVAIGDLAPRGVALNLDVPQTAPEVVIEMVPAGAGRAAGPPTRLIDFASGADAAILSALQADSGPPDLPDDDDLDGSDVVATLDREPVTFVPVTVAVSADSAPLVLNISVRQRVLRIAAGTANRISVLDVRAGMLVADIVGPSTFDRLRSLLLETRGSVKRMFLAAWDQALAIALAQCGSQRALAETMTERGSGVGVAAVAAWMDDDRIGPRDARDVARIGHIAQHPVVAQNATAITETMRQLRILHQSVGRAVVASVAGDSTAFDDLEALLGPDAVSLVNETTVYRVLSVGDLVTEKQPAAQMPTSRNGGSA